MAEVALRGVAKRYGKVEVIHGIDLDIRHGEFTVFVGPSGCGKSTLLRMVAGLEPISDGEVRIAGRRVNELPPRQRDIAMVFQDYALYPHKTLFENMAFGLRLRKTAEDEIQRRVMNAARLLRIDHMLDRRPAALSGGQRQRVAIGRAIVREPQVFLFDEPLSNLDAQLRNEMRSEIKRLHQRLGATIINAIRPTPELAPWMSTFSSFFRRPAVISALCIVCKATGRVVASSKLILPCAGIFVARPASVTTYSASAWRAEHMTRSPTAKSVTPTPRLSTSPAHSSPTIAPAPPTNPC